MAVAALDEVGVRVARAIGRRCLGRPRRTGEHPPDLFELGLVATKNSETSGEPQALHLNGRP
jgi:hypothetical protein